LSYRSNTNLIGKSTQALLSENDSLGSDNDSSMSDESEKRKLLEVKQGKEAKNLPKPLEKEPPTHSELYKDNLDQHPMADEAGNNA